MQKIKNLFFKMNVKREIRGITLIALVITILVLLILAGVTINAIQGNNGIINKTTIASEETKKMQAFEELKIKVTQVQTDKQGKATLQDIVESLQEDKQYEYVVSLQAIATIKGNIPDVTNATEIYVLHKDYQFKIESNLNITIIESKENDSEIQYTQDGEWIATVPVDNWFTNAEYYDTSWEGEGTEESPYLITTERELAGLSYQVTEGETFDETIYFQLTKNLNMGEHIWVPIGGRDRNQLSDNYYKSSKTNTFKGNFDGAGFTISGLYYNNQNESYGDYVGLFGYVNSTSNKTIQNVGVIDSYFNGHQYVGGIFGYMYNSQVKICYSTAILKGTGNVGGITGYGFYSTIDKSYNKGNIYSNAKASGYFGGLIGGGYVSCYSSYNKGKIEIKESGEVFVGGISGYVTNSNVIRNSYNVGTIYVKTDEEQSAIGGIYGEANNGYCYNCYNIGDLEITQGYKGGLVGNFSSALNTLSLNYCYFKNSIIDAIGCSRDSSKVKMNMVGKFESIESTVFHYDNEIVEEAGYEGDLLTKLNKWVNKQTNKTNYFNWKMDEELQYPVFIYEE